MKGLIVGELPPNARRGGVQGTWIKGRKEPNEERRVCGEDGRRRNQKISIQTKQFVLKIEIGRWKPYSQDPQKRV